MNNQAIKILISVWDWIWQTSVMGALTIVLIMLVKWALRNKMNIRWQYSLWFVLLIRLLLPWAPESPFSIYQLLSLEGNSSVISSPSASSQKTREQIRSGLRPSASVAELNRGLDNLPVQNKGTKLKLEADAPYSSKLLVSAMVWLSGAAAFTLLVLIQSRRVARIMRQSSPVNDVELLELYKECRQLMGIRTNIPLMRTLHVDSPTLYGFIRSRLLLPKNCPKAVDLEDYRYIFMHELTHWKRRDIGVNWLMTGLQVMHWFNPLVWYAFSRMREDQELACDALTLNRLGSEHSIHYGKTLVKMIENKGRSRVGMAGFFADRTRLFRRIRMVAEFSAISYKRSRIGLALLLVLAACSLTNPAGSNRSAAEPKTTTAADQNGEALLEGTSQGNAPSQVEEGNTQEKQQPQEKSLDMVDAGTVLLRADGDESAGVRLPLIAIAATYGVDGPEPHPVAPLQALPEIRYSVPADQSDQLAAYWMTQSWDGSTGILFLGPRGWKATTAEMGANGSIAIMLTNSEDVNESISYSDTSGGCQGCAISEIATYFPDLREWAENEMGFYGKTMAFKKQTLLHPGVMAYEKENETPGYETNGVAYEQHDGDAWFRLMEIKLNTGKRSLAETMLNYFLAAYGHSSEE